MDVASVNQLYILPSECIDCAMCVPVCPVSAIFWIEELPDKWRHFAEINADWYAEQGAPSFLTDGAD